MEHYKNIVSKNYPNINLRVIPGHFANAYSHTSYYIDMSLIKSRHSDANMVAKVISEGYFAFTQIDTIVCMDGCEVIGAYLANYLTEVGTISMNAQKTIFITTPEFSNTGQLLFRDNVQHMIKNKHVLLLLASANGVSAAVDVIQYYGGEIVGISAIFSAVDKIYDFPINAIFTAEDVPGYHAYSSIECELCKTRTRIDAITNGYGLSKL